MDNVLVVVGYTDYKYYTLPLYPRAYDELTYENKELLFVDENNYPEIATFPTGDRIASEIRAFGIREAKKRDFEWVLFLDVDLIPDPDVIQKLLNCNHPFVGGVTCTRGNPDGLIGHRYIDYKSLERIPLNDTKGERVIEIGGISGAMMMIHKSVFNKCDYSGYKGIYHYPNRTTCDDEWYCIEVHKQLGIRPQMHLGADSWHLNDDGYAYRYQEKPVKFERTKESIIFRGKEYVQR